MTIRSFFSGVMYRRRSHILKYHIWIRVHSNRPHQNSLTFPWHLPDSIHISLTKRNNKSVDEGSKEHISKSATPFRWWCQQNKLSLQWDYLIKFLSLDLANWSIYVETGESCCPKWSFSLTLSEIPWRFSSILQMSKFPWHSAKFPDNSLTLRNFISPWHFPDGYEPCGCRTKLSAAMYSQRNSLYLTWLRTVGDVPPFTLPAITVTTILVPYLQVKSLCAVHFMMTSSIWDIFRVTSPLRGEFTVHRWIHLAKASDAELWCFLWSAPQQTVE